MKSFLFALVLGIAAVPAAQAACTAPVGRYVGSGAGLTLDSTGIVNGGATQQVSVRIPAGGIWKAKFWQFDETGHTTGRARIPAIGTPGNSFNTTTCHGLFTDDGGGVSSYVVSNRGKVIQIMPWTNAPGESSWIGIITLNKM